VVKQGRLEPKAYVVPRDIELEIARLKLVSMDVHIDELTPEQDAPPSSWAYGT